MSVQSLAGQVDSLVAEKLAEGKVQKIWMTPAEAAAYTHVKNDRAFRRLAKLYKLPHYRIGILLRFKVSDIDKMIERTRTGAA